MDAGDPVIISASTPATQGFGNVPTGFNTDQVKDVKDILSLTTGQIAGIAIIAVWAFITFGLLLCCLYSNHRDRKYERESRLEHIGTWQSADTESADLAVKSLAYLGQPHVPKPDYARAREAGSGGRKKPTRAVPPSKQQAKVSVPPVPASKKVAGAIGRVPPGKDAPGSKGMKDQAGRNKPPDRSGGGTVRGAGGNARGVGGEKSTKTRERYVPGVPNGGRRTGDGRDRRR